jgi:hypothetical protein
MIRLIQTGAALALFIILCAGCSTTTHYWCHPTKQPMDKAFDQDRYACDGESYQRAKDRGEQGDSDIIKQEWKRCMYARGWSPCPEYSKEKQ